MALLVIIYVWSAGDGIGDDGCFALCKALQANTALSSVTILGVLCSAWDMGRVQHDAYSGVVCQNLSILTSVLFPAACPSDVVRIMPC